MVVAVVAMLMVQSAINEIVDVIAMRHGFMTTARTMIVRVFMAFVAVFRRTAVRVVFGYLDHVLVSSGFGPDWLTAWITDDVTFLARLFQELTATYHLPALSCGQHPFSPDNNLPWSGHAMDLTATGNRPACWRSAACRGDPST